MLNSLSFQLKPENHIRLPFQRNLSCQLKSDAKAEPGSFQDTPGREYNKYQSLQATK